MMDGDFPWLDVIAPAKPMGPWARLAAETAAEKKASNVVSITRARMEAAKAKAFDGRQMTGGDDDAA